MKRNSTIENELKDLKSSLAGLPSDTGFAVPDGYFEGLEKQILDRIHQEAFSDTNAREEIQQLSPVMAEIVHKNTYQVEPGYFEKNLNHLTKITQDAPAPVIRISFRKQAMKLALAACFVGLTGFFIFISLYRSQHQNQVVAKGLQIQTEEAFNRYMADLNEEEIIAYLDLHHLTEDQDAIGRMIDPNELPDEADCFDEAVLKEIEVGKN